MMLMQLPIELLDQIIVHTLLEGFESVALTCKRIYARCRPFIEYHNKLRSRFRTFEYYLRWRGWNFMSASDLLTLIAAEPVVARYIRTATFKPDSRFLGRQVRKSVPSIHDGGPIVELFANSLYLKEAGLDWKEYYTTFESDIKERRYSQHGAAFLLTLLPNIEKLIIPQAWKPNEATDKLLEFVIEKAKQSTASSLASVTRFEESVPLDVDIRFDLRWASPFLVLPRLRSFLGPSCLALEDIPGSLAFRDSHYTAETLQAAYLVDCCSDEVGIANFLKHTLSLKMLTYSHCTKTDSPTQDWDICKFINAVEREAGSHLVHLSIAIDHLPGSIVPGQASIRGFQRLETLQIPMELVMCNIPAAARYTTSPPEPFADLIPASVTWLSLLSKETDHHEEALNALFRYFHSVHNSQLSALEKIYIPYPESVDDAYKNQCNKVAEESYSKGVIVHLKRFPSPFGFPWDEMPEL
ncbi:F-box domain protein [Xylogone sp. PMI_703]|nr:F-box domain protein [Xylogone sp. PMI_703]